MLNSKFKILLLFIIHYSLFTVCCFAQDKAVVYGKVTGIDGNSLETVNVSIFNSQSGTITDKKGNFKLEVPANKAITIVFSFIGFKTDTINVKLKPGEKRELNKTIISETKSLPEVEVEDKFNRGSELRRVDPKFASIIPTETGGIEALIKTFPGVSSNNEMSSQYSVRGGNFDENLVYVNDIEIYRPQLISAGQQEGLSFVNPDLVSSVLFSAGGFDPKYGDKMSSVLDIQYKKPTEFGGSVSASLLGGTAHIEGTADNNRISYLFGVRQKSDQYLLNSLQTQGYYNPSYTDAQGYIDYQISKKWDISFLGNYSRDQYNFIPQSRQTTFGTIQLPLILTIYFEGQEKDAFNTYLGALTTTFKPNDNLRLKFIVSGFNTNESETYDILGQYYLNEVQTNQSSQNYGKASNNSSLASSNLGVGGFLNHARDYLNANVFSLETKGSYISSFFQPLEFGIKYNKEIMNAQLNEWNLIDSADYSLPRPGDLIGYTRNNNGTINYNNTIFNTLPSKQLLLNEVVNSDLSLNSNRISGFIQNRWSFKSDSTAMAIVAGLRASYWDVNKQLVVGPRTTFSFKPDWKNDIVFRYSTGFYYQPPFFKELIDLEGNLHTDIKAQTSVHVVGAMDWNFMIWNRPFKFIAELYYKYLYNLVPYQVEDVKITYYSGQTATGYATGIDFKINGDFVKGLQSWASLSIMQTKEVITNSGEGFIPRPTDQLLTFGMFFQDYLPMNPTYKMSLNFLYGSGLPFGPPDSPPDKQIQRMPAYFRVDIGFSKQIKSENNTMKHNNPLRVFKNIWISLEVLNLLGNNNVIAYTWVKDVNNQSYAVPNYLTPREVNLKLYADF